MNITTSPATALSAETIIPVTSNCDQWQITVTYLDTNGAPLEDTTGETGTLVVKARYVGNQGYSTLAGGDISGNDTGEMRSIAGSVSAFKVTPNVAFTGTATHYKVTVVGYEA